MSCLHYLPLVPKSAGIMVQNRQRNRLRRLFRVGVAKIAHVGLPFRFEA